jgi:hypothetical protein
MGTWTCGPTLRENSLKTLSRVGLRCRACDFRLRRPRRLTRRLDEEGGEIYTVRGDCCRSWAGQQRCARWRL